MILKIFTMKRVYTVIALIMIIAGFSSCDKDYTCACTFDNTSKNFEVKLTKMRKNDAKTLCDDYSVYVGNCALK